MTEATTVMARVLIVDDHPAVCEALANRIRRQPDLTVFGEAQSVDEATALIESDAPEVAVVDIALKGGSGLDLIKIIAARHPQTAILVWSMYDSALYADRAMRAGARGYITKEHATEQIVEAIRRVRDGGTYLGDGTAEVDSATEAKPIGPSTADATPDLLSNRELEVFRMLGEGQDMHAISERLQLSMKTIETYRARIKRKLNVKGRTQLIQVAVEWSLSRR